MCLAICFTIGLQDGHLSQSLASSSERAGAGPCLCQDRFTASVCPSVVRRGSFSFLSEEGPHKRHRLLENMMHSLFPSPVTFLYISS